MYLFVWEKSYYADFVWEDRYEEGEENLLVSRLEHVDSKCQWHRQDCELLLSQIIDWDKNDLH